MGGKTSTSTSATTIPDQVLQRYASVNQTAENTAQTPFQQYGGQFVAGLTPTQDAGVANTNASANEAQPYFGAATGLALNSAAPIAPQQYSQGAVDQYLSPYLNDVVGATQANINESNAQQQQQEIGRQIKAGSYGGDRSGVANAELARQQNLASQQTISGLLNSGFQGAQQQFNQQQGVNLSAQQADAARQQQAAGLISGLGTGAQTAGLQGAQAQLTAGGVQQGTQQADLTANYNQFLQQQAYPFQVSQFLANIAEGTGALSGSTTTTQAPAPFFSDDRLKEGKEKIGKTFDGQNIYKFRYKGQPETHMGLIAQEVARKHPRAVGLAGGYGTVDYDAATEHAADVGQRRGRDSGGLIPYLNDNVKSYVPLQDVPIRSLPKPGETPKPQDTGIFDQAKKGVDVYNTGKTLLGAGKEGLAAAQTGLSSLGSAAAGLGAGATDAATAAAGTAAGSTAADILPFLFLKRGGRIGKDDGGGIDVPVTDTTDPTIDASGDYAGLDPIFRDRLMLQQADLQDRGVDSKVISGLRDSGKQDALYAQGRSAPGAVVTNARGGDSYHNYGMAADLASDDPSQMQDMFRGMRDTSKPNGLTWGGNFKSLYDPDHVQMGGVSLADLKAGAPSGVMAYADSPKSTAMPVAMRGGRGLVAANDDGLDRDTSDAPSSSPAGGLLDTLSGFLPKSDEGKAALLGGLGAMLSSPSHYLLGSVGSGLVGGVSAYNQSRGTGISQQQVDVAKRKQAIDELLLRQKIGAMTAAQNALGGSGGAAPPTGLLPSNIVAPNSAGAPVTPTPTGIPSVGAVGDAAASAAPPQTASKGFDWSQVSDESNPVALDQKAANLEKAANNALYAPEIMNGLSRTATQLRTRAAAIRQSGIITMKDGSTSVMPGFIDSQAAIAGAKTRAEESAKQQFLPQKTPTGAAFVGGDAPGTGTSATPSAASNPSAMRAQAEIDPATADVKTAIPPAPPGGGFPVPNVPKGARITDIGEPAKELAKTDADFSKTVLSNAPIVEQGIERFRAMAQAYKLVESGAGADKLYTWAAYAASLGYPDMAKRIQGGDPAAVEWVRKEGVNLVLNTLSAANPRFAQAEFKALAADGVPNTTNRPQANHQLVTEGLGTLLRQKKFQDDWTTARSQGWESPSTFFEQWSKANPLDTFMQAAQRQIGNFKGMDLPPRKDWVEGSIYVAPKSPPPALKQQLGAMGIQPGQTFKYNGPNSPLRPLGDADAFNMGVRAR